jgi:hypothetical protein
VTTSAVRRSFRAVKLRTSGALSGLAMLCLAGCGASHTALTPRPAGPDPTSRHVRIEQLDPHIAPKAGDAHTAFKVSFTVREPVGHRGSIWRYYDVLAHPPPPQAHACWANGDHQVGQGEVGHVVSLVLRPDSHGWCAGRYEVGVAYDGEPYCIRAHRHCDAMSSILAYPVAHTYFKVR